MGPSFFWSKPASIREPTILCGVIEPLYDPPSPISSPYGRTWEMYELWDAVSLNMIDCYGSASQAEAAIAETVKDSGLGALSTLVLVHDDGNEETRTIAEGQAILV